MSEHYIQKSVIRKEIKRLEYKLDNLMKKMEGPDYTIYLHTRFAMVEAQILILEDLLMNN